MKPVVFYDKKKENYYLLIKKVSDLVHLRLLTKSGVLTNTKLILQVSSLKSYSRINNCTMYQRVKFNKIEVDKIAFDDFIAFLNTEARVKVKAGIRAKNVDEALRLVSGVVFSVFHLTKKQGVTFDLNDVLAKMDSNMMGIAVKKSIIQYLQDRYNVFEGGVLEDAQVLRELELAKVIMSFSENHDPIRRAARKYMTLVTTDIKERFYED